jgi:cysteine desulfurase
MIKPKTYYFDSNATTGVAPEVLEAMLPYLTEQWGNPSSPYRFGKQLVEPIEQARESVAALIGADAREIIFTSCGTESINTALTSALYSQPAKRHIVTTAVEHSATKNCCAALEKRGYSVTYLPVNRDGSLDLATFERSLRPDTALVSIMWANNETGVLFPIAQLAALCRQRGILIHTDAVQVPGKLKIDVNALGVDLLSLSAHKLHGPKGIGLLYVRRGTPFRGLIIGGHQEDGRRGGTENVPYIVGFGRAAALAGAISAESQRKLAALRDTLEDGILSQIPHTTRNGAKEPRLPNTTSIAFAGVEAEALLMQLDELQHPRVERFGLHDGFGRAVPRPDRPGAGAGGSAQHDPFQPRLRHVGGGRRLRAQPSAAGGGRPAHGGLAPRRGPSGETPSAGRTGEALRRPVAERPTPRRPTCAASRKTA